MPARKRSQAWDPKILPDSPRADQHQYVDRATPRQETVLAYIVAFREEHEYSPTVAEIAAHFDVAVNAIAQHIAALRKKGRLKPSPGNRLARSLVPA